MMAFIYIVLISVFLTMCVVAIDKHVRNQIINTLLKLVVLFSVFVFGFIITNIIQI